MILLIILKLEEDYGREICNSPCSLIFIADMLAILITHAKEDGKFAGLSPHLVEGGVHSAICGK
jgi:hypothetical protein